jgi:hypothetical protein
VTGIVARCYAAGECGSDADTEAERVAALAKAYTSANPSFGFTGDALASPNSLQYLGYALYAGRW